MSDYLTALHSLPPLRDVIRDNDLRATKKLGQNFLLDLNLTDKIVRVAGDLSDKNIFEIGPGPGGLTRSILANQPKKLYAIEFDERAVKALQAVKNVAGDALEILHEDALQIQLPSLSPAPRVVIANLPYNIATPLLVGWLRDIYKDKNAYDSMTLMFQREVALRITAPVESKAYGRLAVLSQWLCEAKLCFDVPASAFTPPPKIVSSIVHLTPKNLSDNEPPFELVEKITADAFGQRRKMIRSSLKKYQEYFEEWGVDETLRAENITVEEFIALARIVDAKSKG